MKILNSLTSHSKDQNYAYQRIYRLLYNISAYVPRHFVVASSAWSSCPVGQELPIFAATPLSHKGKAFAGHPMAGSMFLFQWEFNLPLKQKPSLRSTRMPIAFAKLPASELAQVLLRFKSNYIIK